MSASFKAEQESDRISLKEAASLLEISEKRLKRYYCSSYSTKHDSLAAKDFEAIEQLLECVKTGVFPPFVVGPSVSNVVAKSDF